MPNRRHTLLLLIAAPLSASAATAGRHNTKAKNNPRDNGESSAERDRRLARECRNLPNAGACRGFGYGS